MAGTATAFLSTTWTNPCGKNNIPPWTLWTTPTPAPATPTLFWDDHQPSSCFPSSFSAMSWGMQPYSPAVCPSGYITATSTINSQNKETNAVCCPSGFSLYSMNSFGLDCWTSFSAGSPGTGTVIWSTGGGSASQIITFTSGAANGYYISIAWKEGDFANSGSLKSSRSSPTVSGSGSSRPSSLGPESTSNNGESPNTGGNGSSNGGGLSTGAKIGLGVGLGIGLFVLFLVGLWFVLIRKKARSAPPVVVDEKGRPELDGKKLIIPEIDGVASERAELETTGNAAELAGTNRGPPTELPGWPVFPTNPTPSFPTPGHL